MKGEQRLTPKQCSVLGRSVIGMDFAMSIQSRATEALLLLRAAGYDDASYEGRRTGVSGHIISVSDDPPGNADEMLGLVHAIDPDAQLLG